MPILIDKKSGDGLTDTRYQINNFRNLRFGTETPSEAIGELTKDDNDGILIKVLGPNTTIEFDYLLDGANTNTGVGFSITQPASDLRYCNHILKSSGSGQILDKYRIVLQFNNTPETSGTATSGSTTTLTDTGKSWTADAYAFKVVKITGGTGSGQIRTIRSNTTNTLTIELDDPFDTAPASGSTYEVIDGITRKGAISKFDAVINDKEPLTFNGHVTFQVGTPT